MINLIERDNLNTHLSRQSDCPFSDEQLTDQINKLKEELRDQVTILGHHYQSDQIIQFADYTGDSLELSKRAATINKPYIIFCGVHFMAETADMLTSEQTNVILPDLNAGCSMADMASGDQVQIALDYLQKLTAQKIIPVTYVNSTAQLKAVVGRAGGAICTSSNALDVISWAMNRGDKLFFLPDQHLGRNSCFKMGIPLNQMCLYNPNLKDGGLGLDEIKKAKIILWHGYCSVHQGFNKQHIVNIKTKDPQYKVIVHPECSFDVVQNADLCGSTSYIINCIDKSPPKTKFAVGTEINLVNRLANLYTDKSIISLSPYQCLCTTMYRIRPPWLYLSLKAIKDKRPINIISVPKEIKKNALLAINKMMEL